MEISNFGTSPGKTDENTSDISIDLEPLSGFAHNLFEEELQRNPEIAQKLDEIANLTLRVGEDLVQQRSQWKNRRAMEKLVAAPGIGLELLAISLGNAAIQHLQERLHRGVEKRIAQGNFLTQDQMQNWVHLLEEKNIIPSQNIPQK